MLSNVARAALNRSSSVWTEQLRLLMFKTKLNLLPVGPPPFGCSKKKKKKTLLVWCWHPNRCAWLCSWEEFSTDIFLPGFFFSINFFWCARFLWTMTGNESLTGQTSLANLKQIVHNSRPLGLGLMGSKNRFGRFQQTHCPVETPPGSTFIWFYICSILNRLRFICTVT